MTGFQLLSELLRGAWLIDEAAAQGYLPLLNQLRAGNFEPAAALFKGKKKDNAPYAVALELEPGAKAHRVGRYSSFDDAPPGSVAVIPVLGPMMSQDFCGSLGTQTLGRLAQEADAHPNIAAHVFVFDTPGGTVAGTESFHGAIAGTLKPAVSYVQGMMASAGYWAGCGANFLMAGGLTTQIGSIGTMLQYADSSKADKKEGVIQKMVRADASFDKNEAFLQLKAGNEQPVKEQLLNPLNDVFLGAVRSKRTGKLPTGKDAENVLSGKVYLAADALKFGLIDGIGSFQQAVQKALDLAGGSAAGPSPASPNPHSTMFNLKASWGALLALVGITATAAPTVQVNEQTLEDLNARAQAQADALATATTTIGTLTTERDAATASVTALTGERDTARAEAATAATNLTASQAEVTRLTAEVTRLGAQPGAAPTNPVAPNGTDAGAGKPVTYVDPNAAHNQAAAAYFQ